MACQSVKYLFLGQHLSLERAYNYRSNYSVFEMNETQPNMSIIERILKQNFQRSPHSSDFNKFISKEPLRLLVMDRIDKNIAYVTDGVHTILTIMATKTEMLTYHALNRHPNQHYTFEPKAQFYLTFKDITPPIENGKHPYSPHHYVKNEYQRFVEFKANHVIKTPIERIVIFEWNLALVNINSVGYYAPVIAIRKFKKEACFQSPQYSKLNCVLYEKWLQQKMESYRINDIRQIKKQQFPASQNICLFYFMKDIKRVSQASKNSSLVIMDEEQRVMKHDKQKRRYYVMVGNIQGTVSFANAQKSEINEAKIEKMNLQNISMLFNGIKMSEEEDLRKEGKKGALWSSESSSSDDEYEGARGRGRVRIEEPMDEESDSDDEIEDPLKNLYLKSLQSRNNIAI